MSIVLDMVAGSPKLTSTALKPATWAFTFFADLDVTRIGGTNGGQLVNVQCATVLQRIRIRLTSAGIVQFNKLDSLSAAVTTNMFTDANLQTRGRLKLALVSDATNHWAFYQRERGDVVRSANISLGTMSLTPESISMGELTATSTADSRLIYHNALLYDGALTDAEVYAQLANMDPSQRPVPGSLIGRFPFRNAGSAMANFAGLTDLTVTGTPFDTAALPDAWPPSWLDRYLVRYQNIAASGDISGSATMSLSATGTLAGAGALTGSSTATLSAAGTLTASGALAGACQMTLSASGTLTGAGALAGATTATLSAAGTLTGAGALAGSSTMTLSVSGALDLPSGAMVGTCSMSLSAAGTLVGTGALNGASTMTLSALGVLSGAGALAGISTMTVSISGDIQPLAPPPTLSGSGAYFFFRTFLR